MIAGTNWLHLVVVFVELRQKKTFLYLYGYTSSFCQCDQAYKVQVVFRVGKRCGDISGLGSCDVILYVQILFGKDVLVMPDISRSLLT